MLYGKPHAHDIAYATAWRWRFTRSVNVSQYFMSSSFALFQWSPEYPVSITWYLNQSNVTRIIINDDVNGHQVEIFSPLLALCPENSPVTGVFPHKDQWCGALMLSLICAWINGWVNTRNAGDLNIGKINLPTHHLLMSCRSTWISKVTTFLCFMLQLWYIIGDESVELKVQLCMCAIAWIIFKSTYMHAVEPT